MSSRALIPATEAARRVGVSERRVRALLSSGWIEGSKQAGRWFIDPDSLDRWYSSKPISGRSLSAENAWAALLALAGRQADWLSPWDKSRLPYRLRLESAQDWLPRVRQRASLNRLRGHPGVIGRLSREPRIVLSGISAAGHYNLDISARDEIDAYVPAESLTRLKRKYALEASDRPNVLLRSVEARWPFARAERVAPASAVAIDLLESEDQRARRAGEELWSQVVRQAKKNGPYPGK